MGAPRSGTSLLRAILDEHTHLAVAHESRFLPKLARNPSWVHDRAGTFQLHLFVAYLYDPPIGYHRTQQWGAEPHETFDYLRALGTTNIGDAVAGFYQLLARKQGKKVAGEKSPGYARFLREIVALLPDALVIHLVRDPRSVALSLKEQTFGPPSGPRSASIWREHVRSAEAVRTMRPQHHLTIQYEALIDSPVQVTSQVCEFLGVEIQSAIVYSFWQRKQKLDTAHSGQAYHENVYHPIHKNLRTWELAHRDELRLIEAVASQWIGKMGYSADPTLGKRSFRTKIYADLEHSRSSAQAFVYRLRRKLRETALRPRRS